MHVGTALYFLFLLTGTRTLNTREAEKQRCEFVAGSITSPCSHTPWCSTHTPFLLHLILPEEFNLLPRVPSHNFFKSTFYETAIPFHRGALYSKSYLQSVICGHINMTKVPVCSPALCSRSHYYRPAEASLWDAAVPTRVHQGNRSG